MKSANASAFIASSSTILLFVLIFFFSTFLILPMIDDFGGVFAHHNYCTRLLHLPHRLHTSIRFIIVSFLATLCYLLLDFAHYAYTPTRPPERLPTFRQKRCYCWYAYRRRGGRYRRCGRGLCAVPGLGLECGIGRRRTGSVRGVRWGGGAGREGRGAFRSSGSRWLVCVFSFSLPS